MDKETNPNKPKFITLDDVRVYYNSKNRQVEITSLDPALVGEEFRITIKPGTPTDRTLKMALVDQGVISLDDLKELFINMQFPTEDESIHHGRGAEHHNHPRGGRPDLRGERNPQIAQGKRAFYDFVEKVVGPVGDEEDFNLHNLSREELQNLLIEEVRDGSANNLNETFRRGRNPRGEFRQMGENANFKFSPEMIAAQKELFDLIERMEAAKLVFRNEVKSLRRKHSTKEWHQAWAKARGAAQYNVSSELSEDQKTLDEFMQRAVQQRETLRAEMKAFKTKYRFITHRDWRQLWIASRMNPDLFAQSEKNDSTDSTSNEETN